MQDLYRERYCNKENEEIEKMRLSCHGGLRPFSSTWQVLSSNQNMGVRLRIMKSNKQPLKLQKNLSSSLRNPRNNAVPPEGVGHNQSAQWSSATGRPPKLAQRWEELQGLRNWDGLLDPLDDHLQSEILRYGQFVEAAYRSFDFDLSSPTYATCLHPKTSLFARAGFHKTGYKITKDLVATCGIQTPSWIDKAPAWMTKRSSWIGYVAVCQDEEEIARLGRRDVVIALRGTATCLEWVENVRADLNDWSDHHTRSSGSRPMVERGFLSMYTTGSSSNQSLQEILKKEIKNIFDSYSHEKLSLTITGHSLGAALAILSAYDISMTFPNGPMVTVISFGGPRVGDQCFRSKLMESGTRVLKIVNSDDLITKVPGFVIEDADVADSVAAGNNDTRIKRWIKKFMGDGQWGYADVGQELRVSSRESPHFEKGNVVTCHDLKTYLHLVKDCSTYTCSFKNSLPLKA